ncbi:MAG: phosphoenolpyruvate carboxylase [Saprospiraceae bacterium]|nr:phosphoenolpyruvate carboxylase [Saprospiraceae bacterium]MBK8668402.1 phosphoenolpyruvate carboxylase [Saprospiraceae bacterium]
MPTPLQKSIAQFQNDIAIKFQLYNSLFLSLPFVKIEKTGILLSVLLSHCEEGFAAGQNVEDILDSFLKNHTSFTSENDKTDLMFRSIQYIERQIVLFDALEDAAYNKINDLQGSGTLKQLESRFANLKYSAEDNKKLEDFCVRLVLTAHPTQFYPGSVLGIINDLTVSLKENDTENINLLLQQLGKTPFLNKQKPTPYDEAVSLIWFLENVFYQSVGAMINEYKDTLPFMDPSRNAIIKMGFWPGGDRDGNPFVLASTTYQVATSLHIALLKCYYRDVRKLKRRLTFKGVDTIISKLENDLYEQAFLRISTTIASSEDLLRPLNEIKQLLLTNHNGLFVYQVEDLINKIHCFGLHFAFIDIRQENEVHSRLIETIIHQTTVDGNEYNASDERTKIAYLKKSEIRIEPKALTDVIQSDTILTMQTIRKIQNEFGEAACHRYIISQCSSALNVIEVLTLFRIASWDKDKISVDIVPLFETIDDLINAPAIMENLYQDMDYRTHLEGRKHKQTIMLGFSDGTKDGGYLMANWMIYKAKENLSELSRKYGITVLFFDGRGGPPARGGGKTHKFYASMDKDISSKEIQLTIQGQTISSNFGIMDSARYNIEQLVNAGVTNNVFADNKDNLDAAEEALIFRIAEISLEAYLQLKNHPDFVTYMTDVSPLKYFGMTNIGSRPAKRGKTEKMTIKDLRAIPFVASWNMIKQNVPGFYGLGTALQQLENEGKFEEIQAIYRKSLFFRTLIDNSEMTLFKTFMPLTAHVAKDPVLGVVRKKIDDEYHLTCKNLIKLGNHTELMEEYPVERLSVQMRERIVLPLVTIQQYALSMLKNNAETLTHESRILYETMVVRCAFGIINAGRNSA